MSQCQYANVHWIRRDSPAFIALMNGLKSDPDHAVTTFMATLGAAHKKFDEQLKLGADVMALLRDYQETTGIISTRDFTLPDVPDGPGGSPSSFSADMIEGIAGALSTEVGIGISFYTLIMDLVQLLNIKIHVRGILMNNGSSDLENLEFFVGWGQPNVLPLSRVIPAPKKVMNPVDKKNYDCVGFVLFGAIGAVALEGLSISLFAEQKAKPGSPIQRYCQYYSIGKGVAVGREGQHDDLRSRLRVPECDASTLIDSGNPVNPIWFELIDEKIDLPGWSSR